MTLSRRDALRLAACGFGSLAFNALASANPRPHHVPKATRAIFLFMAGGPSQHDLFDYKPRLVRDHGRSILTPDDPNILTVGLGNFLALAPASPIRPRGQSGMMVADLLPHLSTVVDDICLLRATHADNTAHAIASLQLHTGHLTDARPSIGSWISYGLGTENRNLPSFVTIHPDNDVRIYGAAFLPANHQGTAVRVPRNPGELPIRHLNDPAVSADARRRQLDLLQRMNQRSASRTPDAGQVEGLIESFELAFRMQAQTPALVDLSSETRETVDLYGINNPASERNGRACLLARRLSEAGVRFVQVTMGGWDHHGDIRGSLPGTCASVDQPIAALLKDLKRRGLLDDTIVWWSGEFGRTAWSQDLSGTSPIERHGREHQPDSFCSFLAGGGIRGGLTFGETDDLGYRGVAERVHLHDVHATILHQLGLDHERLTHRHAGRDFRLTDVYGNVVREILA